MSDELKKIGDYTILREENVGENIFYIGEKIIDETKSNFITGKVDLKLRGYGIDKYKIDFESENYNEVFSYYLSAMMKQNEMVIKEVQERPKCKIIKEDCQSIYNYKDLIGKIVVLDSHVLYKEYQSESYQLYIARGGFGCDPKGTGNAVYAVNIYSDEETRLEKYDLIGVIKEEKMPKWAKEKLKQIEKGQKKKSKDVER